MKILLKEEETSKMRCLLRGCFITQNPEALQLYSLLYCHVNKPHSIDLNVAALIR